MKKFLILTPMAALVAWLAGCASEREGYGRGGYSQGAYDHGYAGAGYTDHFAHRGSYYLMGNTAEPNEQGAGAANLTGAGGQVPPGYGSTTPPYYRQGSQAPAPVVVEQPTPRNTTTTVPSPGGATGASTYTQSGATSSTAVTSAGSLSQTDASFLHEAIRHGKDEIKLGRALAERSPSKSVREFGRQMAADHKRINDELTELAARKGVTVTSTTSSTNFRRALNDLEDISGKSFNKQGLRYEVLEHEADLRAYQRAADGLQDPELRSFAQQTVPSLQQHLTQARQLESDVTGSPQGGF